MHQKNNLQKKILFCAICGNQSESRNYCVISCANRLGCKDRIIFGETRILCIRISPRYP
uniref:Uncharacterized protein n=1 Tax=Meloidogyne incognita TaxID=6306 RepID=A0A914N535_MELIC